MKFKFLLLFLPIVFFQNSFYAQKIDRPKLVVGIIVDQMRYDYLYRFQKSFGNKGFKRLLNEGTNFTYAHLDYVPAYTAPGHASIYTGTVPFYHGIVANNWYDELEHKYVYATEDPKVSGIGFDGFEAKMSPRRILSTTITDQLKITTNGAAKVIAVSLKDRGAVLPGGHCADAAYWYESTTGKFVSSSYYMDHLPKWVEEFNNKKLPDKYLSKPWNLSKPIEEYSINSPDNSPSRLDVNKEGKTSFPHRFDNITQDKKFALLRLSPSGNQILVDFTKEVLRNEKLGKNNQTDFLAVSFSTTDLVGHKYGPNSVEVMDLYIKLDEQLGELLSLLDHQVGKGNYLLFLTADHGGAEASSYLDELKSPNNDVNPKSFVDSVKAFLKRKYSNEKILFRADNQQIFLNHSVIEQLKLSIDEVTSSLSEFLYSTFKEIATVFPSKQLENYLPERSSSNLFLNGYNKRRCGDLFIELQPSYQFNDGGNKSTHGTVYNYDTHIPLLFYGWKVSHSENNEPVYIVDIAATVANLLHIQEPNACIGKPIIKIK